MATSRLRRTMAAFLARILRRWLSSGSADPEAVAAAAVAEGPNATKTNVVRSAGVKRGEQWGPDRVYRCQIVPGKGRTFTRIQILTMINEDIPEPPKPAGPRTRHIVTLLCAGGFDKSSPKIIPVEDSKRNAVAGFILLSVVPWSLERHRSRVQKMSESKRTESER